LLNVVLVALSYTSVFGYISSAFGRVVEENAPVSWLAVYLFIADYMLLLYSQCQLPC